MTPGKVISQAHGAVQDFLLSKRKSWADKLGLSFGHGVG
jgi:hypothetical protein